MNINKKLIAKVTLLSLVFVGAMGLSSTGVFAQTKTSKQKMTSSNKAKSVSLESARKTALKHSSGTVEREEMETQKGKSVYAFDIRNAKGTTREIWVDARTGRMIRNAKKGGATEGQNKVAYSKKKTKH
jgi:lipopolysaccharide export LptBFGC system permease protein LptF